jgi:hypothetical protein
MILAPLRRSAVEDVRDLLAGMTLAPGLADPANALVPFGRFERVHVARILVMDDPTLADRAVYDLPVPDLAPSLVLLAFCDGSAATLLDELVREAGPGLRALFAHCEDYDEAIDLRIWLDLHSVDPDISYVNGVGRTVRQVREEAALHAALREALMGLPPAEPSALHKSLRDAVAGRVPLSPEAPTPLGWRLRSWLDFLTLPVLALLVAPFLLLASPVLIFALRRRERSDPIIVARPSPERLAMLSRYEDHDVTNPFSAIGSLKPGFFRRWLTVTILWVVNWTTHHIYTRGRLARVGTIHFARWVLIEGKTRLFFASNYDGTLESYMDDFINKVAFGLSLVFSNGIGFPRTDWLIVGGAQREQDFKAFLRHHQIPTQVWYKAYPGLTTYDLARNARIRRGFEQGGDDAALRRWLAEI